MTDAVLSVMATNGMRTSHHIASTIIEHRHDEAWLRQHIHNDAHYASLMAVIREKEETLKQRVIRALAGFSGYGQVMVVGGGRRLWLRRYMTLTASAQTFTPHRSHSLPG